MRCTVQPEQLPSPAAGGLQSRKCCGSSSWQWRRFFMFFFFFFNCWAFDGCIHYYLLIVCICHERALPLDHVQSERKYMMLHGWYIYIFIYIICIICVLYSYVLPACGGCRLSQTLAHAQSEDTLSDSHSVAAWFISSSLSTACITASLHHRSRVNVACTTQVVRCKATDH